MAFRIVRDMLYLALMKIAVGLFTLKSVQRTIFTTLTCKSFLSNYFKLHFLYKINIIINKYNIKVYQMIRLLFKNAFRYYNKTPLHSTEVFQSLTNKQLATPEMMKALVRKSIPFHSRMSQIALYHKKRVRHAIKSCFSEKKTKRFKRVHKVFKVYYSNILQQKIRFTLSMKAKRCIEKMGDSIDTYILCTKPKDLDSKFGEYIRTIMLRKINDSQYRVPYILGTDRKQRIKKYYRYLLNKSAQKFVVPKEFKKNMQTFQRKFGTSVDQLNNDDYKKYLELQRLKKTTGNQVEPNHPLILELNKKLQRTLTPEQQDKLDQMAEEAKNAYINHPKNTKQRRLKHEKWSKELQIQQLKIKEAFIKFQSIGEESQ